MKIAITTGISFAAASAAANSLLLRNLAGIGLIGLLMLGLAWVGSDLFILRQVKALVKATKRLAAGDRGTRTGLTHTEGELNQLANAFDQMAETLQKRQVETQRDEELLKTFARQQAVVAGGGTPPLHPTAIAGIDLDALMDTAVTLVALTLKMEYCKVLELLPDGNALLLRSGVGWRDGLVGYGTVSSGLESQAGYTLLSDNPVIVEDLSTETRFSGSPLLHDHGVVSGMSVIIRGNNKPFGVLGVYTTKRRSFSGDDVNFLEAVANVLGFAIARKRTEDARSESEERYRQLVELCPDGIFIQSEGKFAFANSGAVKLFGAANPEELMGKPILDFVDPSDREKVKERMRQLREEIKEVPLIEEKFLQLDGTVIDVEVAAIPFTYQGKLAAQVVARNITERKQTEEGLRKSEELYRTIARNFPNGAVVLFDKDLRYTLVEGKGLAEIGLSKESLEGKKIEECLPPETYKIREPAYRAALAGVATKLETKYGDSTYCMHIIPVKNDRVEIVAGMVMSQDITECKQVEEKVRKAKDELEIIVAERTAELRNANEQLQIELAERKQAEEALNASQARLAGILDIAKDAIISVDKNQRITLFNQGAEEIFGYTEREVLGQSLDLLLPLRFAETHRQHINRFAESDETARKMIDRSEVIGRRRDGTEFPAEASISKLELGGEKIFTVILRDITERKRTESALFQLAAIVESSYDAIIGKTVSGIITSWNSGAQKIYGYSADEVKGRPISILSPPERIDEMPQILEKLRRGESITSYETVRMRKDGQRISVSLTVSPIKDAKGKVIGASTIGRDISDRKRVEAALEHLRHQNELILNAAGDGIYGMDVSGRATFINLSAARMLGYEVEELTGQPMHEMVHHTKANGTPYLLEECPLYRTLKDGSVQQVTDEVFWRQDGSSFPVEYIGTPIQEQGKIVGAVVTFKDITERQAIEQLKNEFVSVVSHELRTPLTSIRTSLGLLTSGLLNSQPEKTQWMLEVAMESANRLVRLVNDILDIERIESGKVAMNKEVCEAADLMVQAADVMRAMAEKAGVILSVTPKSVRLWADSDRIIQTLTNLLSNAIKFSPQGETVWLTAECQNGEMLFQVKDGGRGIPADKLETIFGRFQQVDASDARKQGGTGLGLAICRSIVQQHGGRIWAQSILGEGSSFYFTLPILREGDDPEPKTG